MSWGDDHHGKTTFGRWENRLHDAYQGDDDQDEMARAIQDALTMSQADTRYVIAGEDLGGVAYDDSNLTPLATLPAMQPGDSVRVTVRDDGGFDVVPLRRAGTRRLDDGMGGTIGPCRPSTVIDLWVDAPEQENDR